MQKQWFSITKYFSVYLYQFVMRDVVFIKLLFFIRNSSKISNAVIDTAIYRVAIAKRYVGEITFNRDTM